MVLRKLLSWDRLHGIFLQPFPVFSKVLDATLGKSAKGG